MAEVLKPTEKSKKKLLLPLLALLVIAGIATGAYFTYARYRYQLNEQTFDVETAGFFVDHSGVPQTIVYNSDAAINFLVQNTDIHGVVNAQDITFKVSMHYGNGTGEPALTAPDADFDFFVNDVKVTDGTDTSPAFTIPGGSAALQNIALRFEWTGSGNIGTSEYVYIKVKTTSPYVTEYVFRVVVLGKMFVAFDVTDKTDAFGNPIRDLTLQTARSFGAGLPNHQMKICLRWDANLSIDTTNPLVKAVLADAENADSIVNGGAGGNFLYLTLNPSALQHIWFYENGTAAADSGNITAEVEVLGADVGYYNKWQAKNSANAQFGWDRAPDSTLPS